MIISFYSYKGGVGRTQVMLNIGLELVKRGRGVALVDVDLEAPGVHHILDIKPEPRQSLIDYLILRDLGSLSSRVMEITHIKGKSLKQYFNKSNVGRIVLFPSIPNRKELCKIPDDDKNLIFFFDESVKRLKNMFDLDFIFLDSRTGFGKFAPLTLQVANIFALVTRLDAQNAHGMKELLFITEGKKRLLIASQVPESTGPTQLRRDEYIKNFKKEIQGEGQPVSLDDDKEIKKEINIDFVVPFDERMIWGDSIPVLDFKSLCPINKSFCDIADRIEEMAI